VRVARAFPDLLGLFLLGNTYLMLLLMFPIKLVQPDRVEGLLRAPLMSDLGAQLRWKGEWANPNPSCQHSLWEETGVRGENPRLSVERFHISVISPIYLVC
jgi:hypothetical protein